MIHSSQKPQDFVAHCDVWVSGAGALATNIGQMTTLVRRWRDFSAGTFWKIAEFCIYGCWFVSVAEVLFVVAEVLLIVEDVLLLMPDVLLLWLMFCCCCGWCFIGCGWSYFDLGWCFVGCGWCFVAVCDILLVVIDVLLVMSFICYIFCI